MSLFFKYSLLLLMISNMF